MRFQAFFSELIFYGARWLLLLFGRGVFLCVLSVAVVFAHTHRKHCHFCNASLLLAHFSTRTLRITIQFSAIAPRAIVVVIATQRPRAYIVYLFGEWWAKLKFALLFRKVLVWQQLSRKWRQKTRRTNMNLSYWWVQLICISLRAQRKVEIEWQIRTNACTRTFARNRFALFSHPLNVFMCL